MSNLSESIGNSKTPSLGDSDYEHTAYYFRLAESINFYGLSLIIPFGLVGNCFSICVLLLSSMLRRTTTGQYLIALALADSTVLVGDGIRWLASRRYDVAEYYFPQNLGLNVFDTSNAACKITQFLRYGGCLWSVWITIAIAVERLISVAFPHKIDRFSTMKITRIAIVSIVVVSFCLGSFPFWTLHVTYGQEFGVNMTKCAIYDKDAYNAWNNAVLKLATLLIPGVLITILTIVIIVYLCRSRCGQKNAPSDESARTPSREKTVTRLELSVTTQMTVMLVAVCVATIALRTPYTISYYFRSRVWAAESVHPTTHVQTYMAYRITDLINTVNYAINFVLYCVWGSSFRREAKRVFCRGRETTVDEERLATDDVCLNEMHKM